MGKAMNSISFENELASRLANKSVKLISLDRCDSTNIVAAQYAANGASEFTTVISNYQSAGRGRLERSFFSPENTGLYMSMILRPKAKAKDAIGITTLAAVAVAEVIKRYSDKNIGIKWVNDIYIKEKKVCGILTEAESNFETGTISKIIVGIGINCFEQEFPEDIKDKATYITNPQKDFERNQLIAAITNKFFELVDNFDKIRLLRDYKSRSMILGQPILIYGTNQSALPENGGRGVKARAIDIDENGGLVVEYLEGMMSHQMETITSGEVTIRKDYY
jgi:BirA family biotin operon repressor/biotin-[acetyl-CoA-carboxylase] ligase